MAWQLTAGLTNLRNQVNARFPSRDKKSDGSIGDTAHQSSTSGHNPDDTAGSRPAWNDDPDGKQEVRAWDMDSDTGDPDVDAQDVVDFLRRVPGLASQIRYMIYNHRLYHSRDGFAPTAYSGPSPHTEHIHFEGAWTQAADENATFDFRLDDLGDDMTEAELIAGLTKWAKTEAGADALARAVLLTDGIIPAPEGAKNADGSTNTHWAAWSYLRWGYEAAVAARSHAAAASAGVAKQAGQDDVDEAAIIAGVLAGLDPQVIAQVIPQDLAQRVADELAARLTA